MDWTSATAALTWRLVPSKGALARLPLGLRRRPPGLVAGAAGRTPRPLCVACSSSRGGLGFRTQCPCHILSDETAHRPPHGQGGGINCPSCAAVEGHRDWSAPCADWHRYRAEPQVVPAAGVPWATQRGDALLGSVLCFCVWVFVCFLLSPLDQK